VAIAVAFFFAACSEDHGGGATTGSYDTSADSILDHSALAPVLLTGAVIAGSPAFGMPGMLEIADSILWVLDLSGDPAVHAINLPTAAVLRSEGRRGEGPGEFSSAITVSVQSPDSSAAWVFDVTLQRMTRVVAVAEQVAYPPTITLDGHPRVLRAIWMGASKVVGLTNSDTARVAIFDQTGHRIVSRGAPLLGDAGDPLEARLSASTGFTLCSRPDGSGFVVVYFGAGRVDFFDSAGVLQHTAQVPFATNGHFLTDSVSHKRVARRVRYYYRDCAIAADNTVFALFAGRSEARFPLGASHQSDFVHVFTPDGTLRTTLRLGHPAEALAITTDARTMFATNTTDGDIYRYPIGSVLGGPGGRQEHP
jgi:hypothetical protein